METLQKLIDRMIDTLMKGGTEFTAVEQVVAAVAGTSAESAVGDEVRKLLGAADEQEAAGDFDEALEKIRGEYGKTYPLHIGGEEILADAEPNTDVSPIDTSVVAPAAVSSGIAPGAKEPPGSRGSVPSSV